MASFPWAQNSYPKGPSWDLGNSSYSTGLGGVFDYWVLEPLGLDSQGYGMGDVGMYQGPIL